MGASPLRMIGGVLAPLDRQPGRGAHARASAPPKIPSYRGQAFAEVRGFSAWMWWSLRMTGGQLAMGN